MKKLIRTSVFVLGMSLAGSTVTPLFALPPLQERDQNRDRDDQTRDRDNQNRDRDDQNRDRDDQNRQMGDRDDQNRVSNMGDEGRFHNNRFYKMGWQDGEHHKHRNRNFKNDDDRMAYEAGYQRGDRGEKWQNHPQDRDHDRDNDRR